MFISDLTLRSLSARGEGMPAGRGEIRQRTSHAMTRFQPAVLLTRGVSHASTAPATSRVELPGTQSEDVVVVTTPDSIGTAPRAQVILTAIAEKLIGKSDRQPAALG